MFLFLQTLFKYGCLQEFLPQFLLLYSLFLDDLFSVSTVLFPDDFQLFIYSSTLYLKL